MIEMLCIYIYIYEDVRLTLRLFIGHWNKHPRSIIPRHRFGHDDQVELALIFVRLEASWKPFWEPTGGVGILKIQRNSNNCSFVLVRLGSPTGAREQWNSLEIPTNFDLS